MAGAIIVNISFLTGVDSVPAYLKEIHLETKLVLLQKRLCAEAESRHS
jgi:hypothetical protein